MDSKQVVSGTRSSNVFNLGETSIARTGYMRVNKSFQPKKKSLKQLPPLISVHYSVANLRTQRSRSVGSVNRY